MAHCYTPPSLRTIQCKHIHILTTTVVVEQKECKRKIILFSRNVLGENINFTKIRQTSSTSLMTLQFVILSLFLFKGVILVLNKLLKSQTYSIWWVAGLVHKRADLYLAVPLSWFPFWSLLSTWNLHIGPVTMWSLPGCALFLLSSQTRRLIASQQG